MKEEILFHLSVGLFRYLPSDQMCLYSTYIYICACRYESFNPILRTYNVYANRAAPSRDMANIFAVMDHLRFICSGGIVDGSHQLVKTLLNVKCHSHLSYNYC